MVYIADRYNNRVQKFTPTGEALAVIDRKGEGRSWLKEPHGVYVDSNNILYVTEWRSNSVCMFSTNGRFLVVVMTLISRVLTSSHQTSMVNNIGVHMY